MLKFCTHFDAAYLPQAATMLGSLSQHIDTQAEITVLWLEPERDSSSVRQRICEQIDINKLGLRIIQLPELEGLYPSLQTARKNRTWQEYCWTLEPALVQHQIASAEDRDTIVYIDADSFFFGNPLPYLQPIIQGKKLVGLTPHHYPIGQESKAERTGKYNFGFGAFFVCDEIRRLSKQWFHRLVSSCKASDCGDQKYLDEWQYQLLGNLLDLDPGLNVGPWQLPKVDAKRNRLDIDSKIISYHFHEFRRGVGANPVTIDGELWNRTNYQLDESTVDFVYTPYIAALSRIIRTHKEFTDE